jgi:hypothetical protein
MEISDLDQNSIIKILSFISYYDLFVVNEINHYFNKLLKDIKNMKGIKLILKSPPQSYLSNSENLVKWAMEHKKFKPSYYLPKFAARKNDLKLIKFLKRNNFPFNHETWIEAVQNENIEILNYLKKNKIESNSYVLKMAATTGNISIFKFILKYLEKKYYRIDTESLCNYAIMGGSLNMLKFLLKEGYRLDNLSFQYAASCDNIKILMYIFNICSVDLSMPWFNEDTCQAAADSGNLRNLIWLRKKNCPWDMRTTYSAVENEHYDVLKWAIENNCEVEQTLFQELPNMNIHIENPNPNIVNII